MYASIGDDIEKAVQEVIERWKPILRKQKKTKHLLLAEVCIAARRAICGD